MTRPIVVVGDGWAALGAVGFLASAGKEVRWISGSGAHLLAPLPSLEFGPGAFVWEALAQRLGIDCGEMQTGSFLREFRNKSFRPPVWTQAPTPDARREVRDDTLWVPETRWVGAFESRFALSSLAELEWAIRQAISNLAEVKRIEGVPVKSVEVEKGEVTGLTLGNGEKIACERLIVADRWVGLGSIEGLPKLNLGTSKREPMGVLQALFTHRSPMGGGCQEGFYGTLHREAGEETERHVWGYFSGDGSRSVWTVALTSEESEDNHLIGKKLRRLKQALDKMFPAGEWLPPGVADFMATVESEQVHLEESVIYAAGTSPESPVTLPKVAGLAFLSDGYGPSSALHQVAILLGDELQIPIHAAPSGEAETAVALAVEKS